MLKRQPFQFLLYAITLFFLAHNWLASISCYASTVNSTDSIPQDTASGPTSSDSLLLNEFREYYYRFESAVGQVSSHETGVFPLEVLGEDINDFSAVVDQVLTLHAYLLPALNSFNL